MSTFMNPSRQQALEIWQAGVSAVDSAQLVRQSVQLQDDLLIIGSHSFPLAQMGQLVIVGGGKAGAGMAAGLEMALPEAFLAERVKGWLNVPADCLPEYPLRQIHLHAARPAGINEPTPEGVEGTRRMLEIVSSLQPNDICLVLLSGGGSALMPAPAEGITLADKLSVTRELSRGGATIEELNLVRRALSRIKGGGLARACRADVMISLIISDVVGDSLKIIASGPTVDGMPDRGQAWQILHYYLGERVPENVKKILSAAYPPASQQSSRCKVFNHILGSNSRALEAAGQKAEKLGFRVLSLGSENTGSAAELGHQLVNQALEYPLSEDHQPLCVLCGGETTVQLESGSSPGKGGRNQEVALAAVQELQILSRKQSLPYQVTLLSAGTDGEDGPTDAAGGFADAVTCQKALELNLTPAEFLKRHDAYHFLQACQSLLITGPTHTNVMDLAVVLIHPVN